MIGAAGLIYTDLRVKYTGTLNPITLCKGQITMNKRSTLLSLLTLLLLALLTGLVAADEPIEGRAGRTELRFMEGMMDHHQMALDMAGDCLARAATDELRSQCQTIIDAQSAEIDVMKAWLLEWYNVDYTPVAMMGADGMNMAGMNHSMPGMPATDPTMMMGMMAGLNRAEGVDYDIAWLESMLDHHDDAIHMSERLIECLPADSGHAELLALANQIIADQTAESELMEEMIVTLSS